VDTFVSLWEFASEEIVVHLKEDLSAENLQVRIDVPDNCQTQCL
jgi:hypothetical protein